MSDRESPSPSTASAAFNRYGRNPRGRGAGRSPYDDDDENGSGGGSYLDDAGSDVDSGISMSSGLSPRGSALENREPLDLKEATKVRSHPRLD